MAQPPEGSNVLQPPWRSREHQPMQVTDLAAPPNMRSQHGWPCTTSCEYRRSLVVCRHSVKTLALSGVRPQNGIGGGWGCDFSKDRRRHHRRRLLCSRQHCYACNNVYNYATERISGTSSRRLRDGLERETSPCRSSNARKKTRRRFTLGRNSRLPRGGLSYSRI